MSRVVWEGVVDGAKARVSVIADQERVRQETAFAEQVNRAGDWVACGVDMTLLVFEAMVLEKSKPRDPGKCPNGAKARVLARALATFLLTPETAGLLRYADRKAVEQAEKALAEAVGPDWRELGEWVRERS